MPLPKTKDVGKVIDFLKKENPDMSHKQAVAIALEHVGKSKKYSKDSVKLASKIRKNKK